MNRYILGGAILAGAAVLTTAISSIKSHITASRLIMQCEEYSQPHPPKPDLDARLAEFEFKNLVGDTTPSMNYLWAVYNSKSTNKDRGTLETKDEITEFLKSAEFDFVEFYIMDNGRQIFRPVAILQKNGDMTRVFYDKIELQGFGAYPSYWVGCFPGWSIDKLIKLSVGVDQIMDDVNIQRTLHKFAFPN